MKQSNQLMKRLTAICLAVVTMIGVSSFAYAAELRYGKVTGNGVNLRSAPTTASYVMTNLPENTSVAEDKAVYFSKGNIADLAEKLQHLCSNPELVENLREGVDEFVLNKYSWQDVAKATCKLYEE